MASKLADFRLSSSRSSQEGTMKKKGLDTELDRLIKRKLDVIAKIRELRVDSAKLNIELHKRGGKDSRIAAIITAW
jgi:hypothetical protein